MHSWPDPHGTLPAIPPPAANLPKGTTINHRGDLVRECFRQLPPLRHTVVPDSEGGLTLDPRLSLAQDPAVLVQVGRVGLDECWEARFAASARNGAVTYAARPD